MHLRKFSFLFILFYLSNIYIYSQEGSRSSLENERDVTFSKIQEAEKILLETEKSKKLTVGRLNVINKQIKNSVICLIKSYFINVLLSIILLNEVD